MLDIVHFILVGAGYFSIPINLLELLFGNMMKLHGNSLLLSDLAFNLY